MRIINLQINKEAEELGLQPIKMKRLGQVVALFGPNGAGKTRLLKLVHKCLTEDTRHVDLGHIPHFEKETPDVRRANVPDWMLQQTMDNAYRLDRLYDIQKKLFGRYGTQEVSKAPFVNLLFTNGSVVNARDCQLGQIRDTIGSIINNKTIGVFGPSSATLYLSALAYAKYDSDNPHADNKQMELLLPVYEKARGLIRDVMQMEFGFVPQVPGALPSLDGRPIVSDELSAGQRILLKVVVYLLQQESIAQMDGSNFSSSVVLIDEPEVHLHPQVLIECIQRLRNLVKDAGQIWVATHSVSLLPFLDPSEVWVMEHGAVKPPSAAQSEGALRALIGGDENLDRLRGYFDEPIHAATAAFMSQCLNHPTQAPVADDDPQIGQVRDSIEWKESGGVVVLDFGAGKGRLAGELRKVADGPEQTRLTYLVVEPRVELHPGIRDVAGPILADEPFTDVCGMPSRYDASVDVAVICNVLHEIRPTRWKHQLSSVISRTKKSGCLLVLEDQAMPKGEGPNDIGYVVLGVEELKTLFGSPAGCSVTVHPDARYRDRLTCLRIPAEGSQVTDKSVRRAITDLERRLGVEVEQTYTVAKSARDGRLYAFKCQMLINSQRALRELSD